MRRAATLSPATRARIMAAGRSYLAPLAMPVFHFLLALVALLGVTECAAFVVKAFAYPKVGYDFAIYFSAALALRDNPHANIYGLSALQSAASAHGSAPPGALYLYPPVLAVLLIPLTLLSYALALRLWLLLNLVLWLAGTALLAVELRRLLPSTADASSHDAHWRWRDPVTAFAAAMCVFLGLAYGPLMQAFQLGQVTMLIFVIIIAVPYLLRSGHDRTAGVLLALATLLKLFPAVLIVYFLLRGRRRVVVSSLVTLAGTAVALVPVLGLDGLLAAGRVLTNGGTNAQQFHNQALARVPLWIAAAFGGTPSRTLDATGDLLIVAVLAAFIVLLWRLHRAQTGATRSTDETAGYSWAVATMVLASPILWEHYDAWLLPVAVTCLGYGVKGLSRSPAPASKRLFTCCACAAILAYALTANALPLAYDGLTTFSPGPFIGGHPIRPYFMLFRPLAAALLWVVAGVLSLRSVTQRAEPIAPASAAQTTTDPGVSTSAPRRSGVAILTLVALACPVAVIAMTPLTGLLISAAHP